MEISRISPGHLRCIFRAYLQGIPPAPLDIYGDLQDLSRASPVHPKGISAAYVSPGLQCIYRDLQGIPRASPGHPQGTSRASKGIPKAPLACINCPSHWVRQFCVHCGYSHRICVLLGLPDLIVPDPLVYRKSHRACVFPAIQFYSLLHLVL